MDIVSSWCIFAGPCGRNASSAANIASRARPKGTMDKRNRQRRQTAGALISTLLPTTGRSSVSASPSTTVKRSTSAASRTRGVAANDGTNNPAAATIHNSPQSRSHHYYEPEEDEEEQTMTPSSPSKPSNAQPRPALKIPPRGIGPISDPNVNDVLCGRGGRINAHAGNVQFRVLVQARKKQYLAKETRKLQKAHIAAEIVQNIRQMDPAGRFLKEDADGMWFDIGDAKAIKKVGQALREDAPDFREEDDDDDDSPSPAPNNKVGGSRGIASAPDAALSNPAAVFGAAGVFGGGLGGLGNASYQQQPMPRFSGAAAAAIRETTEHDLLYAQHQQQQQHAFALQNEAFGRQFHPAAVYATNSHNMMGMNNHHDGSSLISGLSNPTLLSGMSLSSGISDPHLAANLARQQQHQHQLLQQAAAFGNNNYNAMAMRANQLQQLRMQWAASQAQPPHFHQQQQHELHQQHQQQAQMGATAPSDYSRLMLARAGLVGGPGTGAGGTNASLLASSQLPPGVTGAAATGPVPLPAMATNANRVRSDSMSWTGNSSGHTTLNEQMLAQAAAADVREDDDAHHGRGNTTNNNGEGVHNGSVLSIGDDTYPSMAESIMSDLSENLIALDLAEPRLLDQI